MGVHGLWKLIESSGKPIPIETLENKVLAVDVSIWLHQAIKGFQDSKGAPIANAHLLGLYHRVCKLIYFKIKPIFVFDGGVPALKRQTIAKRNQVKSRNASEADRLQKQLLSTLLKHSAVSKVLSEKAKASLPALKKSSGKYDNLYVPSSSTEFDTTLSSSEDEDTEETTDSATTDSSPTKQWDLHTIDTTSIYFKSLPLDVKHEILTELKETRKQNTWAKLHLIPKQSDDFSSYQMKRLLKRQEVQSTLDEVSKEMGGASLSLAELESLLKDQGIKTTNDSNTGRRIASDENTRYLYIKDLQEEIKKAEVKEQTKNTITAVDEDEELKQAIQLSLQVQDVSTKHEEIDSKKKRDLEEEEELKKAIQLSLEETPSTSVGSKFSFLDNFNDADFISDSDEDYVEETITHKFDKPNLKKLSSAQSYMLEYSGLSRNEIDKIIDKNTKSISKPISDVTKSVVEKLPKSIQDKSSKIPTNEVAEHTKAPITINLEIEENIQHNSEVEIMSDSDDESNDEMHLPKVKSNEESIVRNETESIKVLRKNKPLEIIIDPNKTADDDGLFDDIFAIEDFRIGTSEEMHKVNDPNKTEDAGLLFGDIFNENKIAIVKEDFQIGTTEETCKADKNITGKIEAIEEDKILTIKEQTIAVDRNKIAAKNKEVILICGREEMKELKENLQTERIDLLREKATKDTVKEDFQIGTTEEMCKADKNNIGKIEAIEEDKILTIKEQTIAVDRNKIAAKNKEIIPQITREEMEELKENLQTERIVLLREKATKERLASNITDQMYQDAQELLELFGVPYVVAPMEAEAQCAFLDEIELTNGTITDDSDIWLFGGRTVYKNFFNQSKYVMEFKSENIEHHFKLNRQQMILMALLVGSDYTTGVQGVGPVTALEILASFPPSQSNEFKLIHHQLLSGLKEFKSWFVKGKSSGPGRSGLKSKLKKITFTDGFPSSQVVEAYLEPKVDPSGDAFSWGKPDITGLTVFAKDKFGWTMKKTEEILKPVIKKMEETQTQKSIKEYFKTKFKIGPANLEGTVSKRVKIAIDKIGKTPEELIAEEMADLEKEKNRQIRKTKGGVSVKSKSTNSKMKTQKNKDDDKEDTDTTTKNKKEVAKRPRKTIKKKSGEEKVETACEADKSKSLAEIDDIKDYENLAVEIKTRRKRRNELLKIKIENPAKKIPKMLPPIKENIPKELEDDAEVKLLEATTSRSNERVEQINIETVKSLEKNTVKKKAPRPTACLHTKEVIQQKLRDKSNLLRNKLKAIEVYRKSTRGPGYVPKRSKKVPELKEDAGLSEDSD